MGSSCYSHHYIITTHYSHVNEYRDEYDDDDNDDDDDDADDDEYE